MTKYQLGQLSRLDPRIVWQSESAEFTPWLAADENLALLGETIGIDLELEATEKNVGPFRADILCKDTGTGSWVLIENQLGRTDHTHLGQLLTYAAGLKAVTIVWVAAPFAEEHRAALDWLNEVTQEDMNFFGLEIEVWRIGDSPPAPKFNIVSQPNDWSDSVASAKSTIVAGDLTDTKKLQLEYWTALRSYLLEHGSAVRPQKPQPQHWTNFSIGRSGFRLDAYANTRDRRIAVALIMSSSAAKAHFLELKADQSAIEAAVGSPLDWRELPGQTESHVFWTRQNTDPADRASWPAQHAWLCATLESLYKVLAPRVRRLGTGSTADVPSDTDRTLDQAIV
jgi:hypothetical protein